MDTTKSVILLLLLCAPVCGTMYELEEWAEGDWTGTVDTETDRLTLADGSVWEAARNGGLLEMWPGSGEWGLWKTGNELVRADVPDDWDGVARGWAFVEEGLVGGDWIWLCTGNGIVEGIGGRLLVCERQWLEVDGTLGAEVTPVRYELRVAGDAGLDGRFDSRDFVQVFGRGRYETGGEARWSDGDWTGDGRFDSKDLVAAFQTGQYEVGGAGAVMVPEPSALVLLLVGMVFWRVR